MHKIAGIAHLWQIPLSRASAPQLVASTAHSPTQPETAPTVWLQGHLLSKDRAQQFAIIGVPASNPPRVHECMLSSTPEGHKAAAPKYFDMLLIPQSSPDTTALLAQNVEQSAGSGDILEMTLEGASASAPLCGEFSRLEMAHASRLRLSTTQVVAGQRAVAHLEKYSPHALESLVGAGVHPQELVICLAVVVIEAS